MGYVRSWLLYCMRVVLLTSREDIPYLWEIYGLTDLYTQGSYICNSKSSAIYITGTIYVIGIAKEAMCNTIYIIICYGNQHMLHLGSLTSTLCSQPFCFGEPVCSEWDYQTSPNKSAKFVSFKSMSDETNLANFQPPKTKMGGCMNVVVHNDLQSPRLNLGWLQ